MKYFKFFSTLFIAMLAFQVSFSQSIIRDTVLVNGNCGMCKKTIETSAKKAGATTASWNSDTKILQLSYDPAKTNSATIQTAVAKSGYDTQDVKATDEAYKALDGCCLYDRKEVLSHKKSE